jgi:hypothetical protein
MKSIIFKDKFYFCINRCKFKKSYPEDFWWKLMWFYLMQFYPIMKIPFFTQIFSFSWNFLFILLGLLRHEFCITTWMKNNFFDTSLWKTITNFLHEIGQIFPKIWLKWTEEKLLIELLIISTELPKNQKSNKLKHNKKD